MGKRGVRVVVIPKGMTLVLLLLVSGAMIAFVWALSGHAYASGRDPLRQLFTGLLQGSSQVPPREMLLAAVMPFAAMALLFVPWGFLFFALVDRAGFRFRSYLSTVLVALVFALVLVSWQVMLPTRVMNYSDTLANATGALAGAALSHLRRGVRVRFEI